MHPHPDDPTHLLCCPGLKELFKELFKGATMSIFKLWATPELPKTEIIKRIFNILKRQTEEPYIIKSQFTFSYKYKRFLITIQSEQE